jgi:DNA-binding transcriptional LysR family regulator
MNWNDLKFVLAVSQARSFQGAARKLRVTHTTVSRRVAALEQDVGAPLFLRENNLCVPTAVCARLVIAAGRIEEEVRNAERAATMASEIPSGAVHVSSVHWIINAVLLPAAPRLHAEFPGIQLRFYGGLYDGPRDERGKIVALRFELQPARGEEVIPIANFGYAVYAPAGCADPDAMPWISFGGSVPYNWLESQGVLSKDVLITVGDATAVHVAVRSGVGKGLMPECIGDQDPLLRRISGAGPEFIRTLRLVGEWSEISSMRCQSVIGWMEQSFNAIGCAFSPEGRKLHRGAVSPQRDRPPAAWLGNRGYGPPSLEPLSAETEGDGEKRR